MAHGASFIARRRRLGDLVGIVTLTALLCGTVLWVYPAQAAMSSDWQVQYSGNGTGGLWGVSCPTVMACAVAGISNKPGGPLVITTTDGGAAWTQHLPNIPPNSVGQLRRIACPTTEECLASGVTAAGGVQNQIVVTHDFWATWSLETLPKAVTNVTGLACPTANVCWAAGYEDDPTLGIVASYVFRTDNRGATWRTRPIPANATVLWGFSCPTVSACWANGQTSANQPMIIATTNRGVTWKEQTLPSGIAYPIVDVSCATTTNCMAVGATPSQTNATLITTDGGATWRMAASEPNYAGALVTVSCVTKTGCQVIGNTFPGQGILPEIFTTSNDGKSWTTFGPNTDYLEGVDCARPADCWVVGDGLILSTSATS